MNKDENKGIKKIFDWNSWKRKKIIPTSVSSSPNISVRLAANSLKLAAISRSSVRLNELVNTQK